MVIAEAYGVSTRTVYRYTTPGVDEWQVELAGWTATFAAGPDASPVRVSPWRRIP